MKLGQYMKYFPKSHIALYLFGIGTGLLFPIVAFALDLYLSGLPFSAGSLVQLHRLDPTLFIVDTTPLVFGVFAYMIVRFNRRNEATIAELLSLSSVLEREKTEREDLDNQLSGVLEKSPISYVIISTDGMITYVNPATEQVLGSADTVSLNILEFSTVKNTQIEVSILLAMEGQMRKLQFYRHISATTGQEKYLNMVFVPFRQNQSMKKNNVLMISSDVTNETQLINKIEETYLYLAKGLANALDARDQYTSDHSASVRHYSELILEELDLSARDKADILIAAELHDIGKIGVADRVLLKEGRLTEEEFAQMKLHPVIGANLFTEFDGYQNISNLIMYHHERVDGRGYPGGLAGEEIPLGSAIICVADAYDAMTTDRVYREALGEEAALEELLRCRGTQFRPDLVDILVGKIRL